jgi:type I restriction enzyme, S subunit
MIYPTVALSQVADINPRKVPWSILSSKLEISFVPMEAVSELTASITEPETRLLSDVRKGYTPFEEHDVLFAKITPSMENGKVALAENLLNGRGFGSTEFHILRAKEDVLPEYLYYFLRQSVFRTAAKKSMRGAVGQQRVPTEFLSAYPIPVPPLIEQQRIIVILRQADELRNLRRKTAEEARELLPALFIEIFGDPIRNERRWLTRTLARMGNVSTGNTPPRNNPNNYGKFIEWIKSDNLDSPLEYVMQSKEMLSEKGAKIGRIAPRGSTLITCIAGSPESIGKSGFVNRDVAFNQQINAVTPAEDVNSYFLYAAIKLAKPAIQALSSGGMKGIVNKSQLEKLTIIYPPKDLQDSFSRRVIQVLAIKEDIYASIARLDELFESTLSRAFSGELTTAWREAHTDELHDAAVQHDIALGLRGAEPSLGDVEDGRVTQEERRAVEQMLEQSVAQLQTISSSAFQGILTETLRNTAFSSFETLAASLRNIVDWDSLRVGLPETLAPQLNRLTEMAVSLQQGIGDRPIFQPAPDLAEQLRSFFVDIGELLERAQTIASQRAIRRVLDDKLIKLLEIVENRTAYVRSEELILDGVSLAETEERLRILAALGLVRQVQVSYQQVYRRVDLVAERALPEGLDA